MTKPLLFIGCSKESLHLARIVQRHLARKVTTQIWDQGFFPPGSYVMETLIAKGDTFDYAILLFSNDDVAQIRNNRVLVAQDNTVLEAGFFIGRLG
jgi:predicted nucleotide-binding protein